LRADWTNRDDEITRELARFNRNGVPLYVLYDSKAAPTCCRNCSPSASCSMRWPSLIHRTDATKEPRCCDATFLSTARSFGALALRRCQLRPGPGQAPGQPAPAFTLTDLDGRKVNAGRPARSLRGAGVDQPALPVRAEALRQRQHAVAAAALYRGQRGLAGDQLDRRLAQEYLKPDEQKAAGCGAGRGGDDCVRSTPTARPAAPTAPRPTPHMYVIDPKGTLVYAGAIDDKRSANPADVKTANNFVVQAFAELRAGRPLSMPSTPAYGCTIKYG
jgi:hypothetical protein